MIKYFRESFRRKKARRFTAKYPTKIQKFNLEKDGEVEFAVWQNPMCKYESKITQGQVDFFRKFVKSGDLAIDIGTHSGDTSIPMALATGKEGVTIAFDPNPYVFDVLEQNAKLNKDKTNIVHVNSAISTEEGEFYFVSSEASFANGGISPTKDSRHGKFVHPDKIKGVNLYQYLKNNYADRINKLSFIKIDTEGYDKEILKSISDLIETYRPALVAESFGNSTDEAKMELFSIIDKFGYDIFYFEDFEADAKVEKIENASDMLKWKGTVDIYATPK